MNTKCYVCVKSNTTHHWVPLFIFSSMVVAASCYGYTYHQQGRGRFLGIKINGIELSTGWFSLLSNRHRYKPTFQQDNNIKHKAKSTLVFLTKKTLNVPDWPSYSFDLYLAWKSMARLENGCLAMINKQFDRSWTILKIIMCKYCIIQVCKVLRDLHCNCNCNTEMSNISKNMFSLSHYGVLRVDWGK